MQALWLPRGTHVFVVCTAIIGCALVAPASGGATHSAAPDHAGAVVQSVSSLPAGVPALQLPWPTGQKHNQNGGNSYGCGDHTGKDYYAIDFNLAANSEVSAVAAGTAHLVSAANSGGYGNLVWIAHGNGVVSLYAHLNSFAVSDGQQVAQGQLLGLSGSTGDSTGSHLHFVIRTGATTWSYGQSFAPEPMSGYTGFGNYGLHGSSCVNKVSPTYTSEPPSGGGSTGWSVGSATFLQAAGLAAGGTIRRNQYLMSSDVRFVLLLQGDGNLVLYGLGGRALWSSKTNGKGADRAVMQGDGNFVLYKGGTAVWATHTSGHGGSKLKLQNDGNLVIYDSHGHAIWATHTNGQPPGASAIGASSLAPGDTITVNHYLRSADGRYALLLQSDQNLVLYGPGYHLLWSSKTNGKGADRAVMQGDGNFVLYKGGTAVWATHTSGHGGSKLKLQNDGNLVIYDSHGHAIWATHTNGKV